MATTTIRLPEDLKSRIVRLAEEAGTTTHGFILAAIAEKTEAAERRSSSIAEAKARYEAILQGAPTLDWETERARWLATCGKKRPI
jgi:predicted transcriptional regulator